MAVNSGERSAKLTIIIPAYNAAPTLAQCLQALACEALPGDMTELIVVDDRSTDRTAAIARQHGARVLTGDGRGPAAARNLGAREAAGELLIFLDADTAPQPGWLEELIAPLADPLVVAVKGAYKTTQRSLIARFTQLEFEEKYARLRQAARVDFVDTGTAAYRRDAFLAAGGFDERFPAQSAEDVELAFRLFEAGARFAFSPHAIVLHRHVPGLLGYLSKKARYGYFRLQVYRRHPRKALGDSYTPPIMALQIALAGSAGLAGVLSLRGKPAARGALAGTLLAFLATTAPLERRALRTDPPLALVVPALVFARAFAQGLGILVGLLAGVSRKKCRAVGDP